MKFKKSQLFTGFTFIWVKIYDLLKAEMIVS